MRRYSIINKISAKANITIAINIVDEIAKQFNQGLDFFSLAVQLLKIYELLDISY